jgi:inhibitor of KinA sporulation pathway (predicted exonuclease)
LHIRHIFAYHALEDPGERSPKAQRFAAPQIREAKGAQVEMTDADDQRCHTRALYFDVEQTCWSAPPPPGMQQEIIEIGVAAMDLETLEITLEKSYFVRPRRWEISAKCTQLTGISTDDIRTARPFPEVLTGITREFTPSKGLCCTWGDDAALIAKACQSYGLKSPFRNLIDLAVIHKHLFLLKDQSGLRKAIEMLGLSFVGEQHTALADALNTARVHASLIRRMRREPDPAPPPADPPAKVSSESAFAAKLLRALEPKL